MRLSKSQLLGCTIYDNSRLKRITHVMDMEGFEMNDTFYPKEIAVVDMNYRAVRFDVLLPVRHLSIEELETVRYVTQNVHGMHFNNCAVIPRMLLRSNFVNKFLKEYFEREKERLGQPIIVAFKGGRYERALLEEIGVSYVNLEDYCCPRYDYLVKSFPNVYRTSSLAHLFYDQTKAIFCDLHVVPTNKILHCPVSECRAFVTWLNVALEKPIPVVNNVIFGHIIV